MFVDIIVAFKVRGDLVYHLFLGEVQSKNNKFNFLNVITGQYTSFISQPTLTKYH